MWLLITLACTFVTDEEWAARTPDCTIGGYFVDADGDTFGNQPARDCAEANAGVARSGDCDDADAGVNPSADEVFYDGVDANCDGADDDDKDGDGYPAKSRGGTDCFDSVEDEVPVLPGDCGLPTYTPEPVWVHPGAEDTPYDAIDSNCTGGSDYDADRDGFSTCVGDCDDTDPDSFPDPSVDEVWYDGIDQNCDGNDGDQDEDGYYVHTYTGEVPEGYLPGDCDDLEKWISPAASEVWYDGTDTDCAGGDDWDQDLDGYRTASVPDAEGILGDDCDDLDATRSPGLAEDCFTSEDDNCDADANDADALGCLDWYRDADADGYGSDIESRCACVASGEYTAMEDTDCDDGDASRFPAASESCDDIDSDCDGSKNDAEVLSACTDRWYSDDDGDGYAGDSAACLCAAESPYLYAGVEDCDDADASVSPAATEVCNDGMDGDCDDLPGTCDFAGTWTTADAAFSWSGSSMDAAGAALAAGGDLDGDGLDELLMGVPGFVSSEATGMVAMVRPLGDAGLGLDAIGYGITNSTSTASFGEVFAAMGDLGGDGLRDLCVGAPDAAGYGEVACFASIGAGYVSAASATLVVTTTNAAVGFGSSFASPGDTDGDGAVELLIGTPHDAAGMVTMIPAGLTGSRFVGDIASGWFVGEGSSSEFGATLATGDLDGDGVNDIVVGAPSLTDSWSGQGGAFVFLGPPGSARAASSADFAIFGSAEGQALGAVTPLVADMDADGNDDLVLASSADNAGVWVLAGTTTGYGLDATRSAIVRIDAGSATAFGASVSAGDLDGDGAAELVVGAPDYASAGAAFVFAGPLSLGTLGTSAASAIVEPTASGLRFGASVAVLGDVEGDGFGDLAVGANEGAGAVYLFQGGGY